MPSILHFIVMEEIARDEYIVGPAQRVAALACLAGGVIFFYLSARHVNGRKRETRQVIVVDDRANCQRIDQYAT
jgi:hypothetical protein